MPVTYQASTPSALLTLTAIKAAHGGVVRDEITWTLHRLDDSGNPIVTTSYKEAQPNLTLVPGRYRVEIDYQDNTSDCGEHTLARNTHTDRVFILNDNGLFDAEKQYFAETDPFLEYDRRKQDRETEMDLPGTSIETPVKDPYHKPQGQSGVKAHPLLGNNAQFDGLPPEVTPDPEKNKEAGKKAELKLQAQLQNQNTAQATNTITPSPLG